MARSPAGIAVFLALAGVASPLAAEDVARATVSVHVDVAARTSLKVSSQLLRFDVPQAGAPVTAAVDFMAGSRLPAGADLVLTVEPLTAVDGPGGAADVDATITFEGAGQGALTGTLTTASPTALARWRGSGLRQGRLYFTLHANAAGSYSLPVRFILSTP